LSNIILRDARESNGEIEPPAKAKKCKKAKENAAFRDRSYPLSDEDTIKPDPLAPNAAAKTDIAAVKAILAEEVTCGIAVSCFFTIPCDTEKYYTLALS